jgi:hypothetical protein
MRIMINSSMGVSVGMGMSMMVLSLQ